jgi:nucleoside-diphosphate-sugar epimerase
MPFVSPVSAEATIWLMSVDTAAKAFVHALHLPGPLPQDRAITLPALRVRMHDLATEIAHQTGAPAGLVSYQPDAALEAAFGALPPLNAARAIDLGFRHDGSADRLVASALATIASTEGRQ